MIACVPAEPSLVDAAFDFPAVMARSLWRPLFALAVLCWIPVVWLQMRMRDVAAAAARADEPLPAAYARYFRTWVALGFPALFAFLAIFYLMIAKPPL